MISFASVHYHIPDPKSTPFLRGTDEPRRSRGSCRLPDSKAPEAPGARFGTETMYSSLVPGETNDSSGTETMFSKTPGPRGTKDPNAPCAPWGKCLPGDLDLFQAIRKTIEYQGFSMCFGGPRISRRFWGPRIRWPRGHGAMGSGVIG